MGTYLGRVDDKGRLHIFGKEDFVREAATMAGRDVEVVLRKKGKSVSNPQRAYLHGVVIPCVQDAFRDAGMNWTKKQVYEWVKQKFFYREVMTPDAEILHQPLDLSDNSDTLAAEIAGGMDRLKQWVAETLNYYIPDPGEQAVMFREDTNENSNQ
jgi:hypothetical protein